MPVTVQHSKTATTPDNTTAEIRPSHWNEAHVASLSLAGNEVIKYVRAGTSSISSGTLSFTNSNGVSFGMSNGVITASHNGLTTQSVQTQGIQSVAAGGNTVSGGGVVFSNANNVSFGLAGSTVTASISAAAQTNQSLGLYASSQTTGAASSTTVDARSLSVVGAGGVSVGMSAGRLVVSGASGGAADGFNRLAAGTQTAGTNTTVQFADSNGVTFGMSGNNQITASHDGLRSHRVSAANGSSSVAGVSFANSNGVSFSLTNGSVMASIAGGGGGVDTVTQYAVGNTAGDSSSNTQPLSSWQLRGAGVASVGYSADGAVIISVPAGGGGGDGGNVLAAGTQTATTLGTVAFADSNGITFGMSGSTRITASHNGLTTAALSNHSHGNPTLALTNLSGTTASNSAGLTLSLSAAPAGGSLNLSAGTTSGNLAAVTFSNANGVSFGLDAGTVTASHNGLTTAALSNHSHGNPTLNLTNLSGTTASASNGLTLSLSAAAPQTAASIYAVSNTTQSSSMTVALSALSFHGAGAASVGASNGSVVVSVAAGAQSNQTGAVYAVGNTTGQSSSSTYDARTLSVDGAGIVSAGWSNGTLRISATQSGQAFSAQGGSSAFQTLVFTNSNGVSFSNTNGSVWASVAAQSAQTMGVYASSNTTVNSSSTIDARSLSVRAIGAISAGLSAGELVLSVSPGAQSNQTIGLYASSNTTAQSSSSTVDARSLSFRGAGGVSVGMSAGEVVISGASPGAGALTISAGTQSTDGGTLLFSNFNMITFGMTDNSRITASAGAHFFLHGDTSHTSSQIRGLGNFSLRGAGVTLGFTGNSLQFSGHSQALLYASSNTTGESSSSAVPFSAVSVRGAGNVSVGLSGGELIISATGGGGGVTPVVSADNGSYSFTTLSLSNANGISFGTSAGSAITASHNALTSQSNQAFSAQGGSSAFQTLSFSNTNGVSFSNSNGQVVASVATTYAASNHSHGNPTLALTNLSGTTASASNGLTLSLSANAPGAATLTVSAVGNTTVNSSGTWPNAVSIRGYGILSVGTSNGSLLLSTPDAVDFTQLSVGFSTGGNTAGDTGLMTGRVVFAGGANITLSGSTNAGSQTISIVGGAGGGGGVAISAGTQSVSTGTMVFSNSNNLTFGMSGSSRITMSGALNLYALGNTTQNSSTVLGLAAISLNALGAMTAGYSNGSVQLSAPATSSLVATGLASISTNGSTISIGVPASTASFWNAFEDAVTTAIQMGNGTPHVQPCFNLPNVLSVSRFDMLASIQIASSSNSSHAGAISLYIGMYTRTGSTLSLASSGSQSFQWTNTSSNSINSLTGLRLLSVPMNMSIAGGGDIWIAAMSRTSSTNANWFSATLARVSMQTSPLNGAIGEASNGSRQLPLGLGAWTASSTALPASIAFADLRGIGTNAANNALPFYINGCNFTA